MAVLAEYEAPPASSRPCCAGCASPAERAGLQQRGAGLVLGVSRVRRAFGLGADDEESHLIWWPSDISALIERANTEIWSVAQDYSTAIRQGRISSGQLAAFKDFFNEWVRYKDGLGFFARMSGGTVATVQSYRVRNNGYRRILQSAGAAISAPAPSGLPKPPTDWGSVAKWVTTGAIVVGGAVALGHVTGLVRAFKAPPAPARANPRRRRRR